MITVCISARKYYEPVTPHPSTCFTFDFKIIPEDNDSHSFEISQMAKLVEELSLYSHNSDGKRTPQTSKYIIENTFRLLQFCIKNLRQYV